MKVKLLCIVAIALWTFAVFWGWLLTVSASLDLYFHYQQSYGWRLPPEAVAAVIFAGFLGVGTIPFTVVLIERALSQRKPAGGWPKG